MGECAKLKLSIKSKFIIGTENLLDVVVRSSKSLALYEFPYKNPLKNVISYITNKKTNFYFLDSVNVHQI